MRTHHLWIITLIAACAGADESTLAERCAGLARDAEQTTNMVVKGREGWAFFVPDLRHLGVERFWGDAAPRASRALKPSQADPLPAILDFQRQLKALGVSLLVVPVPPKAAIYPDQLPGAGPTNGLVGRGDLVLREFYDQLEQQGVQVLDLTPAFLKARASSIAPLHCLRDTHWSGLGCQVAALAIADWIRPTLQLASVRSFTGQWETATFSGDLSSSGDAPESVKVNRVIDPQTRKSVSPDPVSPIVLLGDSHALVFHAGADMRAEGAGLPDQLALALGLPVDLVATRGSGATAVRVNLLRRAQKDPAYWRAKRWVVWCFAAREFTESDGWRVVPIQP